MDRQNISPRNSKQTPIASSDRVLTENISKSRKSKTEKLLRIFNMVALCASITLIGAFLFIYCRTLYKQKEAMKEEKYDEVKPLQFGKEIIVTGYSGEFLIVNVKCQQFCSCLLYTERKAFGDADYVGFWEIASESKASNIRIYHIEKSSSTSSDSGAFLALIGSSFYKYQLSCAQRSSDKIVPEGETITKDKIKVFSPITTYASDILFKNTTETLIERSRFIYNLKTMPSNNSTSKVGKMTNYIIPKEYKQQFGLKVRETTPLVNEEVKSKENIETEDDDKEKPEIENKDEDEAVKDPQTTSDTTVNLGNSSLFNVQLVYRTKTPSVIKVTGWIPKSLHLVCVIEKQKGVYEDKIFNASDAKFESVRKSPQFNSFDVSTYAGSKPNEVILAERKADTFLDLNNASPTKFILKLVGVAPGNHRLSCGVSNVDRFESLEFTGSNYKTAINWLKVLEANVDMPDTKAVNPDRQSPQQMEALSTFPNMFEWFLHAGFDDLYLLFDYKVLKKEGDVSLKKAAKTFVSVLQKSLWSKSKSHSEERDEDGKDTSKDTYVLNQILKGLMKDIKVIVNGNLFKKTDLDGFYSALGDQLTTGAERSANDVINVEMKLIVMLKIMRSLSLLSTVPMNYLADMSFKYYGLWREIKQNAIGVASYKSNDEAGINGILKSLVLDLLRLQVIIIRADLFSEREEMVKETINDMNNEIVALLGCNEAEMKVFKNCQSVNIQKGIEKVVDDKLIGMTTHDLLNVDMKNSELGIW